MRRAIGILVGVTTLAFAGCGSGTTTIVETTVIKEQTAEKTYLPASGVEGKYVEPAEYSFYVDGAVVGTRLTWRDWGSPRAIASGSIAIRDPEGYGAEDRLRYNGSVEASGLEECNGAAYYTEALANLPSDATYHPEGAMPLLTPCRDPESLPPAPAPPESSTQRGLHLPADEVRFQTPSGNIVCGLSSESATCEIIHKSYTPPVPKPADCPLDYGNRLSVQANGTASFGCYGDSMSQIAEGTLSYGKALTRGTITCTSEPSGLTCSTDSGGGFFLSVQRAELF